MLRVGGPLVLGIGVVLTVMAIADFFSAFGTFAMPRNFWLAFVGLPLVVIGAVMTHAGYLGPASRYVAGELTPTLRDTLGALGIGSTGLTCPACGGRNAGDAKFCDDCGVAIRRTCAVCGDDNAGDARFCDGCGAALSTG